MGPYGLGLDEEFGLKGVLGTGIYSYADLATNFGGLLFFNALASSEGDGSGNTVFPNLNVWGTPGRLWNPTYFSCEPDRGFVAARPFRWAEVVTPAWDEAINPNRYRTAAMLEKVRERMLELYESGALSRYQLPLDPPACAALREYYSRVFLRYFVSPLCLQYALKRPLRDPMESLNNIGSDSSDSESNAKGWDAHEIGFPRLESIVRATDADYLYGDDDSEEVESNMLDAIVLNGFGRAGQRKRLEL